MSLTKLTQEVNNISTLSDYPNSTEGLTSQDLKERFDKASVDIKDYINTTLTDELDTIHANYEETLATKEEVDLDYLKKTDAEATYETIENVDAYKDEVDETYLKKDDAGEIYLSKEDASTDYLTKNEASTTYDTISNVANIYATKQALAEAQMGAIVDQSVTKEKLSLDVQATLDNAEQNIDDLVTSVASINGKIPSEASTTNQLADKDYVDGRVQENTANFIGRFDSVAELEAYAGTLTNNDYAYVVTQEVGGNEKIVRYRYVANTSSWEEEFDMNNTIFTQSQLDTINSGLGTSDTGKYVNKYNVPSVEKVIGDEKIGTYNDYINNLTNTQITIAQDTKTSIGKILIGGNEINVSVKPSFHQIICNKDGASKPFIKNPHTIESFYSWVDTTLSFDIYFDTPILLKNIGYSLYYDRTITVGDMRIYSNDVQLFVKDIKTKNQNVDIDLGDYYYVDRMYIDIQGSSSSFAFNFNMWLNDFKYTEYQNQFTLDSNTTFTNNQRLLVDTPSTTDLTSVGTNVINNIICDTLLEPSKKYELVYNQSQNKFLLDGLMTQKEKELLFDITLTEAVNQVDLQGIADMLDTNKIYLLSLCNSSKNTSVLFYFGDNPFWDSASITHAEPFIFFKPYKQGTNSKYIAYIYGTYNGSSSRINYSIITGNEYIKVTSGNTMPIGTRIIIKEVS